MHHGVKAGGDSSKSKSDIRYPDTYVAISDLCKLWIEASFILVITVSSFLSVCIAEHAEEDTSRDWFPDPGLSSFPRSCSVHWLLRSETQGAHLCAVLQDAPSICQLVD